MHPFLINFLVNFRLSPLQCVPNVFRVVMGTTVLMEKLGLNLTVHDITYVYRLQSIGRKQYTLVSRNSGRKLVTGLLDSSKGRDKDYLVITRNWQNPIINCPLILGEPGFHRSHILYIRRLILVLILIFWFFFSSSFFFFFFWLRLIALHFHFRQRLHCKEREVRGEESCRTSFGETMFYWFWKASPFGAHSFRLRAVL